MPTDAYVTPLESVNLDSEPLKLGIDEINEKYALQLVRETFDNYEQYRSMNHDSRWNIADTLFYGWLPSKTWEGTTVPRSSLGQPIVFDQIEAALPAIAQEIFVPQDEWFQVETEPGAELTEARQVQEKMSYDLEHSRNDYGLTARNELELAFHSLLLYGNGGISLEWDSVLNRPTVQWVDTRDFYIDPGCPVPNIDEARAVIRRKMMTVDELIARRGDPRMNIPSDDVLYTMSKSPQFAVGDQTKRNSEAVRGVSWTPGVSDYSPNPADRKIEVLLYYSKSRIIWTLNRELVAYNQANPYEFIPFCFAPCYTIPGRFYAQSVADVQEGNQRYIEALMNGRLDQVSLDLTPPRIYKRGAMLTPSQLRWRPGATYQVEGDTSEMALMQPRSELTNVFSEISFIKSNAEERTGINSMTSGIPRPSNTNRTATGVSAVASGSMSRIRYLVSNIENYLIVPMLYKMYAMIQKHSLPNQTMSGLSKDGQLTQVSSNAFVGKMRFRMLASSRMMTREKLAQIFPFLTQYMLNGTFMGELQKTGKTIDFAEMFLMLRDATGTGRLYNFIRDMNEQEQKAHQQPPPDVVMQQQQAQQELQARMQISKEKNQTTLQAEQIKNAPQPPDPQELEQDRVRFMMDMQREQGRIQNEKTLALIKAQAQHDKNRMDAESKRQELQGKQAEIGMKLQGSQAEHAMQMQQIQQAGQVDRSQQFANHMLGLQQSSQQHEQGLSQAKEAGTIKNQQAKESGRIKNEQIKKKALTKKKERGPSA